jgi:phosphatidylinositol-3-phosphatase
MTMSSIKRSFPLSLLSGSACGPAMKLTFLHAAAVVAAIAVSGCVSTADGIDTLEESENDDATVGSSAPVVVPGTHVYDHVVIVIMENESSTKIFESGSTPYIHSLAKQGVRFTNAHAVTHPSEPNYIALFSGSTQGVKDDSCPNNFKGKANLGSQLIAAGRTFKGYSESMPSNGYTGCGANRYARKHNPWVMFDNVPAASNLTFASFPSNYSSLPTVSFVVPNLCNDMHDCSFATGDNWLKSHIDGYAQWAKSHNSLLILTWDEDDGDHNNVIPAVFVGAGISAGTTNSQSYNHYGLLRTLENMYGLKPLNNAASAAPITGW